MLPRILYIGSFNLYAFGILAALGMVVGIEIFIRLSIRYGVVPNTACRLGIVAMLSGIAGTKILFILINWRAYIADPRRIISSASLQTGGVFLGGLLTALIVCGWYVRKHHLPLLQIGDVSAPALAMGHAIGRLGCFAAGCCYGRPTNHFWGVTFTNPLAHNLAGTPLGVPLQPTQLFESAVEFLNFFILYWLLGKKRFHGQVIGTYFLLYGSARYLLEFLRGDSGRGEIFGNLITGTQLIAIGLVIVGSALWYIQGRFPLRIESVYDHRQ